MTEFHTNHRSKKIFAIKFNYQTQQNALKFMLSRRLEEIKILRGIQIS